MAETTYTQKASASDSVETGAFAFDTISGSDYAVSKVAFGAIGSVTYVSSSAGLPVAQQGTWTVELGSTDNAVLDAIAASVAASATAAAQTTANGLLTTIDGDTGTIATHAATLAGAVSGTEVQVDVLTMPTVAVTGTFWQATQPVSGTVTADLGAVDNAVLDAIAASLAGTLTVGSHAVTNAGTFAVQAAQSGTWNITNVSGTVSLPTGASTAAKQPALGTAGTASSDVITVQGIASMTALKVDGSAVTQPVSGTFWQATQPISGTVTADLGATDNAVLDAIAASLAGTLTVDLGANNDVTVTGSVTANAGTNLNTSALAVETGGNLAAIATDAAAIEVLLGTIDADTGTLAGAVKTVGGSYTGTPDGMLMLVRESEGPSYAVPLLNENSELKVAISSLSSTLDVAVTALNGGLNAHDAASAGVNPVLIGGYASAAAPSDVSATNDSVRAWHLLNGAQAINQTFAGVLATTGNGASGTGVQRVTIANDSTGILAGVTTVSTVTNLSQLGGAAIAMGTGTRSAGTQRVTIATDDVVPASQSGTWTVGLSAGTNGIGKLTANSGVDIGDVDVTSVPADPFGANADAASATGSISAKLRFIASTGIPITGTVTVGSHAVTNAGTFATQDDARATGGESTYSFLSTGAVQAAEIKGSAGTVYSMQFFNLNAAARYVRLYNQTGSPANTDTANIVWRGMIPGNTAATGFVIHFPKGKAFSTGIGIRVTAAVADNDNTALAANEITGNVGWK